MRTSTDRGGTFAAARYVAHTNNSEVGRRVTYLGELQLAIGTGVTYLAYTSAHDTVAFRRSLDRGASWSAAKAQQVGRVRLQPRRNGQQGRPRVHGRARPAR